MRFPKLELPLHTTLLYLLFGGLWIFLSDQILSLFVSHDPQQAIYQTFKGWFFILASGILLFLILFMDLTGRKHSEQALRESEERFSKAFYQSPIGIVLIDMTDNTIRDVNGAILEMIGLPREQIVGQNDRQLGLQIDPEVYEVIGRELSEHSMFRSKEIQVRLPNGELRHVLNSGALITIQGKPYNLALLQDVTEHKQAEKALRASEERYRLIAQNAEDMIWTMNMELQLTYVSPAVERALGYSAEEILASTPKRFLTPESYEVGLHVFREEMENARVLELEYRRKDGSTFWVEMKFSLFRDSDGHPTAILGVGRDMTERRRAEQEMAWLASFLERNPNPVVEIDSMGNIFYMNPAAKRIFPDLEIQGLKHPWLSNIESAITMFQHEGITELRREIQIEDAWYTQPLYYVPETGRLRIYGSEITEHKRAEEALRENEERLRLSLQAANQGLYDLNVQTGDAVVNRQYAEMLGYDFETFVETNAAWIERLHPDDRESVAKAYSDYIGGLLPEYKVEFRQRMKDGNWKWILSLGRVIEYDGEGKPLRMLGTHTDITERKRAEEETESRSRQLAALLDASQSLTESLNQAEVLQRITDKAAAVLRVEATAIYLVEGGHLYLGASTPPLPPEVPETLRRALLTDHPHIGEALATRQSVTLPDAADATLTVAERTVSDSLGLRTILYVPLVARKDAAGILVLGTIGKPRGFSQNEMDVVRALSNQAALAVSNAKLYEDLSLYVKELESQIAERRRAEEQIQRQFKYLSALRMIDIAISSSFDLNIILDVVLQQVLSQLGVDASAVMLFNADLQMTEYAASRGFRSNALHGIRLKLGQGYAGQAVLKRETIHISALTETGSKLAKSLQLANEEFVDYYGVPLIVKGEVKGVLEIYHRSYLKADAEWLEFLEALAGQAAIAIDNAQLFESLQRSNLNLEKRVVERTTELNRTNTELEHANRIKDEFLANMSHELRTPLTSILGLSESLREQRRGLLNDHQEKSLEIIESSGRHLLELINDILDLSKIEAGKFDYYPQPISVDDICRSSLAFVKTQAAKKSITVTYRQDSSISKIFADPRRLKQILVNLLSNAVKFTLERGEVILQVNADLEQDLIKFSVIDNGIGIAAHDLRRLFQPFVQVDSGLNRQHEGTGLGLALVQKLTDLHGGSVHVESEVGKGSHFMVNLPCLQEEVKKLEKLESLPISERAETPGASSEMPAHRGLILLADDNMPSILTIGEYLESHGYDLVVAHDGAEALKKAEASHPDLILMDVQMPVMNGLEAIARLREDVRFADTPIVALTALAMPGDRERSLLAGANEYMSKPVSLKRLVGMVDELLKVAG